MQKGKVIRPDIVEMAWKNYRRMALPRDMRKAELLKIRAAFFSGATGVFILIMSAFQDDDPSDNTGALILESLQKELDQYARTVSKIDFTTPTEH